MILPPVASTLPGWCSPTPPSDLPHLTSPTAELVHHWGVVNFDHTGGDTAPVGGSINQLGSVTWDVTGVRSPLAGRDPSTPTPMARVRGRLCLPESSTTHNLASISSNLLHTPQ